MTAVMIPNEFLPLPELDYDGDNPRRVTLLNKNNGGLVCLISRGMEEIRYDVPTEDLLILKMFGPKQITLGYESLLTLHQRAIDTKRFYTIAETENPFKESLKVKRKIPFWGEKDLPSYVASGETLDSKINNLIDMANDRILIYCEAIADRGIWRFSGDKRVKEINKRFKETGKTIYDHLSGVFHEERENMPVNKSDILPRDRRLGDYFVDQRPLSRKIKNYSFVFGVAMPIFSFFPSSIMDYFEQKIKSKYERRFDRIEDEGEKAAVALSEFAIANPKLVAGLKRGYSDLKAAGDKMVYGLQLAATAGALFYLTPWLSIPLAGITAISGLTRGANAIRSGGRDYSGIISTIFERALHLHMEKGEYLPSDLFDRDIDIEP